MRFLRVSPVFLCAFGVTGAEAPPLVAGEGVRGSVVLQHVVGKCPLPPGLPQVCSPCLAKNATSCCLIFPQPLCCSWRVRRVQGEGLEQHRKGCDHLQVPGACQACVPLPAEAFHGQAGGGGGQVLPAHLLQ